MTAPLGRPALVVRAGSGVLPVLATVLRAVPLLRPVPVTPAVPAAVGLARCPAPEASAPAAPAVRVLLVVRAAPALLVGPAVRVPLVDRADPARTAQGLVPSALAA
ncbi:hypothetical protein [Fodinicola feengrottensis]|nr:hypothetical protein [Fodinicola feengrottensis]